MYELYFTPELHVLEIVQRNGMIQKIQQTNSSKKDNNFKDNSVEQ